MPKALRKALLIVDPNTFLSDTRAALLTARDVTDTNTPGTEMAVSAASDPVPCSAESSPVSVADFPADMRVVSTDGSAATFIDRWDADITDDCLSDFATALESARWLDPREGRVGTLANKENVVLITHQRMTVDDAFEMARELIVAGDERITDPDGPAGAIPLDISDGCTCRPVPAWCFFGWARVLELPIIP